MARTYTVFLNRDQIPERTALQATIKVLGFKLTIEDDYDPDAGSGYLPCTLDGEDAGLTMRFDASSTMPGKDMAMTLQWGGDPREQVTVIMIAAALAHGFGAKVRDADEAEKNSGELVAAANKAYANLD